MKILDKAAFASRLRSEFEGDRRWSREEPPRTEPSDPSPREERSEEPRNP